MSNQDRKQFPKSGGKPQPVPSGKRAPANARTGAVGGKASPASQK